MDDRGSFEGSDRGAVDRRGFLALCGAAVLGGCASSGDGDPDGTTDAGAAPGSETTQPTTAGTTETTTGGTTGSTTDGTTETATDPSTTTTTQEPPGRITTDGASWPMHGGGPSNAGAVATGGPASQPARAWALDVEGIYTVASPAVADDRCYTASGGHAYGVDVGGGDQQWRTELDYPGHHYSPAVDGDAVYVAARTMQGARTGGGEGALYALSAADGRERWRVDGPVSSPPTVADGTVYVTSSGDTGVVHALDPDDGSRRWRFEVPAGDDGSRAFSAPAVVGDAVYVTATTDDGSSEHGALYALSATDGSELWRYGVGVECRAAPVISDGTAYVATATGVVHAVDLDDGTARWTTATGRDVYTTPAVDGEHVYLLADGSVVALDRASGERRWRTDTGESLINGLVVAGDAVYTGGTNLTALATADGTVRWQYPIPTGTGGFGSPAVLNGVVFVVACIKHSANDPYDDELFAVA